jgi:hypothetical protein
MCDRRQANVPYKTFYAISNGFGFTPLQLKQTLQAHSIYVRLYNGTILDTVNAPRFLQTLGLQREYFAGDLFKDLGKEMHIQTNGMDVFRFRLVQTVNGYFTEGVPIDYDGGSDPLTKGDFYICTWVSSPSFGFVNVVQDTTIGKESAGEPRQ